MSPLEQLIHGLLDQRRHCAHARDAQTALWSHQVHREVPEAPLWQDLLQVAPGGGLRDFAAGSQANAEEVP